MKTALAYWGMIPERVDNIFSITNKRKKEYHNKKGHFFYNSIRSDRLYLGIVYEDSHRFLIANPSKAVCDYLKVKKIKFKDVVSFLEAD